MNHSLHSEIHAITDTDEHARDFLFRRGILKSSMSCPSCSSNMTLVACSKSKSPDLLIWRCTPCKKFKNIRSECVLPGQKLSLPVFLMLIFYLSVESLTNIAIAQMTGLSENTISSESSNLSQISISKPPLIRQIPRLLQKRLFLLSSSLLPPLYRTDCCTITTFKYYREFLK